MCSGWARGRIPLAVCANTYRERSCSGDGTGRAIPRGMPTNLRVWNFNRSGKLVISYEVSNMSEAHRLAVAWNAEEDRADMRIDIIRNALDAREATAVCAAYTVRKTSQGELFE